MAKLTETQKTQIVELYSTGNYSQDKVAELVGCSVSTVRRTLKSNDIQGVIHKRPLPEDTINKILSLYIDEKKSIKEIANIVHSATTTISKILGDNIRKPGNRLYSANSNYFETIDSEHKAYWLGVFFADGNVTKEHNAIRLNSVDKEWLDLFISDIEYTGTYHTETHKKYKKEIYCLRINDTKLSNDLCSIGCTPAKTLTIKFPSLQKDLVPHFIRGYFDGDGSVGIYVNDKEKNYYTLRSSFCCGSEKFLSTLVNLLPTNYKELKKRKDSSLWTISFSVKDSLSLYNYLYSEATVYLNRKKCKFEDFIKMKQDKYS